MATNAAFHSLLKKKWPKVTQNQIRNPMAEIRMKSESRESKSETVTADGIIRASGFFRPSDFGFRISSARQRGKQIPDFVLHLAGTGDGVRNFGAEHFAVTLSQTMHRHFYRALVCAQPRGDFRVTNRPAHLGQRRFQLLE
jgi:hypothetical protein